MRNEVSLFLALSAALALAACKSHEHPKEHPAEHPKESGMRMQDLKQEYTAAVEEHLRKASGEAPLSVSDEALGKEWRLSLVRIHDEKIVTLGENRFFACADFKDAASGKLLDLDFYASKTADGWRIEPALIHKVEGKPRFTYDASNNRVPAS